jgi:hypothetical protein
MLEAELRTHSAKAGEGGEGEGMWCGVCGVGDVWGGSQERRIPMGGISRMRLPLRPESRCIGPRCRCGRAQGLRVEGDRG